MPVCLWVGRNRWAITDTDTEANWGHQAGLVNRAFKTSDAAGRKEFCLKRCLLRKSVHMGEDEPLGTDSRQWAGIIWLMHLLPPPFPLHKRISSSLALYLSLRRSKRAGICRVLHSCTLVCATAGPRGFGKTGSSSSDVPPLWGCDPHHAKVFRMEAGGRGSVHNVTHASSGV